MSEVSEQDVEALREFVTLITRAGCDVAIVHARKAVLGGLSPKENREIPPLKYDPTGDAMIAKVTSFAARTPRKTSEANMKGRR